MIKAVFTNIQETEFEWYVDDELRTMSIYDDRKEYSKELDDWLSQGNKIASYDNRNYIEDRSNEYKKLNQDELRYNDIVNGTNKWIESIQAIKEKYPKPE